ncbi:hypothetical protein FF1_040188 [Malus domestica]
METTIATATATSSCVRTRLPSEVYSNSGRVQGRFRFGTKKRPPKKSAKPIFSTDRPLWYPGTKAPEWLDRTLVGDYGFDPFGLGKLAEYLQYDYDGLDQIWPRTWQVTSLGLDQKPWTSNRRRFSLTRSVRSTVPVNEQWESVRRKTRCSSPITFIRIGAWRLTRSSSGRASTSRRTATEPTSSSLVPNLGMKPGDSPGPESGHEAWSSPVVLDLKASIDCRLSELSSGIFQSWVVFFSTAIEKPTSRG